MKSGLVLLTVACSILSADGDEPKDNFGDPLPKGAMVRLGTIRGGPSTGGGYYLLAPDFRRILVPDAKNGPQIHEIGTGRTSTLPGFKAVAGGPLRPEGGTIHAVSANGQRAVQSRDRSLVVRDLATGEELLALTVPGVTDLPRLGRSSVSLSADGSVMAFAGRAALGGKSQLSVSIWDVAAKKEIAGVKVLQQTAVSPVLSPDGKILATSGRETPGARVPAGSVRPGDALQLWDARSGKLLATIPEVFHTLVGTATVAFSPDGTICATSASDGAIHLWESATGAWKDSLLGVSGQGEQIAFAPDGKTVAAVATDGVIERWSLPDGKALSRTAFPKPNWYRPSTGNVRASGLVFMDDQRVAAWGTKWGRAIVWEAPAGKLLTPFVGHGGAIRAVQFSVDGREVLTIGSDSRLLRWDAATGKLLGAIPVQGNDGREGSLMRVGPGAVRGSWGSIIYDLKTGVEEFIVPLTEAVPSPDFTRIAGFRPARERFENPSWCEVWDLNTRKRIAALEFPPGVDIASRSVGMGAGFSPDGTRLLTAVRCNDRKTGESVIRVTGWDLKTGKRLGEFTDSRLSAQVEAAASDDGSGVVICEDGELMGVDYVRGVKGHVIERPPVAGLRITSPVFSADSKRLAVGVPTGKGREYAVRIYDWPRGTLLHTFTGHTAPVTALVFSPDGKTLASASEDTTVLIWDLSVIKK